MDQKYWISEAVTGKKDIRYYFVKQVSGLYYFL